MKELISEFQERGVAFSVRGQELLLRGNRGDLTSHLVQQLKDKKERIKTFISWRDEFIADHLPIDWDKEIELLVKQYAEATAEAESRIALGLCDNVAGSAYACNSHIVESWKRLLLE